MGLRLRWGEAAIPFHRAVTPSVLTTLDKTSITPEYSGTPLTVFMVWMRVLVISTGIDTAVAKKPDAKLEFGAATTRHAPHAHDTSRVSREDDEAWWLVMSQSCLARKWV
jgi:hypothetical protein